MVFTLPDVIVSCPSEDPVPLARADDEGTPSVVYEEIDFEEAELFDCTRDRVRAPEETKRGFRRPNIAPGANDCCPPEGSCC